MANLPSNVHVSQHPSLLAKLSQLRSQSASPRDVKSLIHEISLIIACEAISSAIKPADGPKDKTPLGFEYTTVVSEPSNICIVPILRSGLGMVEAVQTMLPASVPIHHLGMYREPSTLDPVEYYNNLPRQTSASGPEGSKLAIIVDPVIATGGTCAAAIQTLREWGARRILVLSVLGAAEGVQKAAAEWPEGTEIWIAGVDKELTDGGMLKPGLGDVGDRLFLTIGK
ncbi:uracil phosphoribosyltransferase domain-containing protein [Trichoderma breve]|uniref:uracil phosphoribosyltransferase n=1 Tax=Trichoderma breve TaxID=2034170 RepID=A0A9W9B288_9HYPO|nr:uracil phosphoribosyltransferase domain-containing protein [Trichoderma breve]KAJ4854172.1 uracil phosphoribosyltransferase domain-containing protein [Trichoderma breve]